nr:aminotransferase class I/II-fold pyridoxal phosphate-dependent enzyme [uncultured Cohaesibacter sp.]
MTHFPEDVRKPKLVCLQSVSRPQGALGIAEISQHFPFPVKRHYFITSQDQKVAGGAHSHKQLWQFMTCVMGQCSIRFEGPEGLFDISLEDSKQGVLVPPGYWRDFSLEPHSCLSVLASEVYQESDYIRDYDQFKQGLAGSNLLAPEPARTEQSISVPFVAINRMHKDLHAQILSKTSQEINDNRLIDGPSVHEFEAAFAAYCGCDYAIGVGNGLDALELCLKAQQIGQGDEVIVPANSFIATALAVSAAGARPVFVDCMRDNPSIDINQIEAAISPRTRAIIPVHLYGLPVDMDPIMRVAEQHDLFVLEDAAQAHGATYKERIVGSLGHAAAFSFYPTKNLGALGDGGCVVTSDRRLAEKLRMIRNYGSRRKYEHEIMGVNSRLDSIQAALLQLKLPHLDKWNQKRRALAEIYYHKLTDIDGVKLLAPPISDHDHDTNQKGAYDWFKQSKPVWHVFPIYLENEARRDALREYLTQHQVGSNIHYPIPIHQSGAYNSNQRFAMSEIQAKTELSLPMDPYLSSDEIAHVAAIIRDFFSMN